MSEQVTECDWQALEEPDCKRAGQLDGAHALSRRLWTSVTSTPHLSQMRRECFSQLYLPQMHSQSGLGEDRRAEEAVALRFEGAVFDRFPASLLRRTTTTDLSGRRG